MISVIPKRVEFYYIIGQSDFAFLHYW